jgi:ribonuclease G
MTKYSLLLTSLNRYGVIFLPKEIIANIGPEEIRVGILENSVLVELVIERSAHQGLVGNIYKGRVENVLPGMQAAFVNIGQDKNGFLYTGHVEPEDEEQPIIVTHEPIVEGKPILVQVTKEAVGTKGARLTTQLTLPGRYLVLMPTADYIGISRRIEQEEERERLRQVAEQIKPPGMGIIVRTAADGKSDHELLGDVQYLSKLWDSIQSRIKGSPAPSSLYQDLGLVNRIVRDFFTEDVEKIVVDDPKVYKLMRELLTGIDTTWGERVQLFSGADIFEFYGLESEFKKASNRRVWLKCGGYLVIDQTEALTVIDVNTGKFVGHTNLADTVLKANIDAAEEIARQLRLRDIGGIIVIDFIDMENESDRHQVLVRLQECLKKDRTKTNVLGLTQLGLVEMTRKKVRPDLQSVLLKECAYCEGRGRVLSEETVAIDIKRRLRRIAAENHAGDAILLEVHPLVASSIVGPNGVGLKKWEKETGKTLIIRGREDVHIEDVKIVEIGDRKVLAQKAVPLQAGQVIDVIVEDVHQTQLEDGIARKDGFVVVVDQGANWIRQRVTVEIIKVFPTHARAKVLGAKE